MKTYILIIALFVFASFQKGIAQANPPFTAKLTVRGGPPKVLSVLNDSMMYSAVLKLNLTDTINVSKIHVLAKREPRMPSLLDTAVNFSSVYTGSNPVSLTLGRFKGIARCYLEVRLEMNDGSFTDPQIIYNIKQ